MQKRVLELTFDSSWSCEWPVSVMPASAELDAVPAAVRSTCEAVGRREARLATISSISLSIAPSAATSAELLSSSTIALKILDTKWRYRIISYHLLLQDNRKLSSSLSWACRYSNCSSCCLIVSSSSRFLNEMKNMLFSQLLLRDCIRWCHTHFRAVIFRQISKSSFKSLSSLSLVASRLQK